MTTSNNEPKGVLVQEEVFQKLEKLAANLRAMGKHRQADLVMYASERYIYDTVLDRDGKIKPNDSFIKAIELLERIPVTIEEFLDSKEFMGGDDFDVYSSVKERLKLMKPDPFAVSRERPHISEIYLGGATGTSKSQTSVGGCLYDAHWWCCFKTPWKLFGSEKFKLVGISFQSRRELTAKKTLYEPFKERMLAMPWFSNNFKINITEKELTIPEKKLRAFYTVGNADGVIGEDILSGIVDEANFFDVITESKKAQGASYDEGKKTVDKLLNRRSSRYPISNALSFGSIYIISSANYCDDLIDRKVKSYDPEKEKHVFIKVDKRWDIVPLNIVNPSGERFPFLLGNETYAGKILEENAIRGIDYPDDGVVEMVPIELKSKFLDDPDTAQLDCIGVASSAVTRFIGNPTKIDLAMEMFHASGNQILVNEQNTQLHLHGMPTIIPERLPLDKDVERYIHVDLSRTKDRCGVAMVKIKDWEYRDVEGSDGTISERLPVYDVELAISIQPSGAFELQISAVRQWIQALKNTYDLNIKAVSYDGQTGFESIELLRKSGINASNASVDRSTEAYDTLKEALYDKRLILPPNELLKEELAHLKLIKRGLHTKVDHDSNFCFVGDTLIVMADGTTKKISEIQNGEPILSYNIGLSKTEIEPAINPRITKYVTEILEIELDNGTILKCTPNHRILLKDGSYKEARDLTEDDDLQDTCGANLRISKKTLLKLNKPIPVYDISCYKNSNFIIADGPVVHNSKDVSDAVAGAIILAKNMRGNLRKHDVKVNGVERRSAKRRSFKDHRRRSMRRESY